MRAAGIRVEVARRQREQRRGAHRVMWLSVVMQRERRAQWAAPCTVCDGRRQEFGPFTHTWDKR